MYIYNTIYLYNYLIYIIYIYQHGLMKRSACESENVGPWAPPVLTQGEVNQVAATSENSQPMPDWTDYLKGETSVGRSAAMLRHAFVGDPWVLKLCTPQEIIHTQHWFQAAKVLRRVEISVFLAVSTWSGHLCIWSLTDQGGLNYAMCGMHHNAYDIRGNMRKLHCKNHATSQLLRDSWEDSRSLENGKWTIS